MSIYTVSYRVSGKHSATIRATTRTLRIMSASFQTFNSSTGFSMGGFWTRYIGGTLSGGSTIATYSPRDGQPPSTASIRADGTLSGGSTVQLMPAGTHSSSAVYTEVFFTVNPGNALRIDTVADPPGTSGTDTTLFSVMYEELRLNLTN